MGLVNFDSSLVNGSSIFLRTPWNSSGDMVTNGLILDAYVFLLCFKCGISTGCFFSGVVLSSSVISNIGVDSVVIICDMVANSLCFSSSLNLFASEHLLTSCAWTILVRLCLNRNDDVLCFTFPSSFINEFLFPTLSMLEHESKVTIFFSGFIFPIKLITWTHIL